jgi:hypothetical protein
MTPPIDPMIEELFHNHNGAGQYIHRYKEGIESRILEILDAVGDSDVKKVSVGFADLVMYSFQLGRNFEIDGSDD